MSSPGWIQCFDTGARLSRMGEGARPVGASTDSRCGRRAGAAGPCRRAERADGAHGRTEAGCELIGHTTTLPGLPSALLPAEGFLGSAFTRLSQTLDLGVLRAMQIVVERALIPGTEEVGALRASARALEDPVLQSDPRRYFAFLDEPLPPLVVTGERRRRLPGGRVVARRLTSEYRPYSYAGGVASDVAATSNRDPILLEHWMHADGGAPRGTVIAIHGFAMGRPRIDAFALFAREWYDRGLDVALLTLPHHGERTPPQARFSGEWFAVPHVTRVAEAVREASFEIQVVTSWLRQERGGPVGLLGLSLGGYLAALTAGLVDDLDFVVPIVPPVCIGDLAWRFFERTDHARRGGAAALGHDELRRAFRVHSPLAHPLRVPRDRVLIVAGRGDRIVPPEHPHALWRHWGEPRIHWFSGSHLAPFGRAGVVREVERHLHRLAIL